MVLAKGCTEPPMTQIPSSGARLPGCRGWVRGPPVRMPPAQSRFEINGAERLLSEPGPVLRATARPRGNLKTCGPEARAPRMPVAQEKVGFAKAPNPMS